MLFYDVSEGCVIKKVINAEMFVHSFNGSSFMLYADNVICDYAKKNGKLKTTLPKRIEALIKLDHDNTEGDAKIIDINFENDEEIDFKECVDKSQSPPVVEVKKLK